MYTVIIRPSCITHSVPGGLGTILTRYTRTFALFAPLSGHVDGISHTYINQATAYCTPSAVLLLCSSQVLTPIMISNIASTVQGARPKPLASTWSLDGTEKFYKLSEEQLSFFKTATGIEGEDELKAHVIAVQHEAYKVRTPH